MKKYNGTPSKKKFRGYNFYIQGNEKLSQRNRKTLLRTSKIHLSEVVDKLMIDERRKLKNLVDELDSNLSDWELLDQWNLMYDNFGYLMSEFKMKWEDNKVRVVSKETFKPSLEFEDILQRLSKLEGQVMKMRVKNNLVNF